MPIRDEAINVFMGLPGDGARLELTYNFGVESYELGTGYNHIAVTVEDLDGKLADLAAKGIEPEKPPYQVREGGSRICFVRDPDGYRIELIEQSVAAPPLADGRGGENDERERDGQPHDACAHEHGAGGVLGGLGADLADPAGRDDEGGQVAGADADPPPPVASRSERRDGDQEHHRQERRRDRRAARQELAPRVGADPPELRRQVDHDGDDRRHDVEHEDGDGEAAEGERGVHARRLTARPPAPIRSPGGRAAQRGGGPGVELVPARRLHLGRGLVEAHRRDLRGRAHRRGHGRDRRARRRAAAARAVDRRAVRALLPRDRARRGRRRRRGDQRDPHRGQPRRVPRAPPPTQRPARPRAERGGGGALRLPRRGQLDDARRRRRARPRGRLACSSCASTAARRRTCARGRSARCG